MRRIAFMEHGIMDIQYYMHTGHIAQLEYNDKALPCRIADIGMGTEQKRHDKIAKENRIKAEKAINHANSAEHRHGVYCHETVFRDRPPLAEFDTWRNKKAWHVGRIAQSIRRTMRVRPNIDMVMRLYHIDHDMADAVMRRLNS